MADAADCEDEAWLFGETFDLEAVLARGRREPSLPEGPADCAPDMIRAARRTAAWLAGLAAVRLALGFCLSCFTADNAGVPFVAAAAVAGLYAAWLALTPVPTARFVAVLAAAALACAETSWSIRILLAPNPGGSWTSPFLCTVIGILAWIAVGATAWAGRQRR